MANFLFADFPGSRSKEPPKIYDILSVGKQPQLSLWDGEKRLYFGESQYQLAYILMNEVIFHCINKNHKDHAIHGGAVHKDDTCIILPGKSGKGKSTLTAWLIANGFQYLTDELFLLSDDGQVSPLTRPINLKVNSTHQSWLLKEGVEEQILSAENGSMIPHRLLNREFSAIKPRVTHILFPSFQDEAETALEEVSPAKSCLYLLQTHVNARNLSGHGIVALSSIVRNCRSYKLVYSSFGDLEKLFNRASAPFSF